MVSVAVMADGCTNPVIHHMDNIWVVALVEVVDHQQVAFMDGNLSATLFLWWLFFFFSFFNNFIICIECLISLGGVEPLPNPDLQTQPAMLTLKQFLATQDDSISDSDAIEKYNEYKVEFKRQQLNEFFVAHKDEEW